MAENNWGSLGLFHPEISGGKIVPLLKSLVFGPTDGLVDESILNSVSHQVLVSKKNIPIPGEMIQFDLRIFFKWVGENHQLAQFQEFLPSWELEAGHTIVSPYAMFISATQALEKFNNGMLKDLL